MKVFITGGTGFIGSKVIKQLLSDEEGKYEIYALSRSENSTEKLKALGVTDVYVGELTDTEVIGKAASDCDVTIHCAFIHNFPTYALSCEIDRNVTRAIGDALAGTNKIFIATAITMGLEVDKEGSIADETTAMDGPLFRNEAQRIALSYGAKGVNVVVLRLPPSVHGPGDLAFMPMLAGMASKNGFSGYIGDGSTKWPAVHAQDAAVLYKKIIEHPPKSEGKGTVAHAIQEEGLTTKELAESIGEILNLPVKSVSPEDANKYFTVLDSQWGRDNYVSGEITKKAFDWTPNEATLLEDMKLPNYLSPYL
ncbi:hypothetical protein BVG19_g2415 [[Candida] boidinii]|nr:hypothetical protein BVG19_g2415 [[Candida] boidinii]OWB49104.1 hypothetical protein B5S27_g643 [[Candida] boidinii]